MRPRGEVRRGRCVGALGLAMVAVVAVVAVGPTRAGAGVPIAGTRCVPPAQYLGLDAYTRLDALPFIDVGSRAASATTADPGGTNDDSSNVIATSPSGANVLMSVAGPGVVSFLRMQEELGAPWTMTADGVASTVDPAQLGRIGSDEPFPYPLGLNADQSMGSSIVAVPVRFADSFEFSSAGRNGNFYALYRKLPLGSGLPQVRSTVAAVTGILRGLRSTATPKTTVRGIAAVGARETTVASLDRGPGAIDSLTFVVPAADAATFQRDRLRIYWDGESTPSVDAPVKYVAGAGGNVVGVGERPVVGALLSRIDSPSHASVRFTIRWPMPFHTSARITLTAAEAAPPQSVRWAMTHRSDVTDSPWWGTFHASYSKHPHPKPGTNTTLLHVAGSGRVVGTVLNFGTTGPVLEGDLHISLDGSRTPQVTLTGTEEWGLGGNYWRDGRRTTLALGGMPTNDDLAAPVGGSSLYRYLVADSIPFNSRAVIHWEHGGENDVPQASRAVVLWYGMPTKTARRTDRLRPAHAADAAEHQLVAPGAVAIRVNSAFAYRVKAPPRRLGGLVTSRPLRFTLRVDPANVGVLLRRTFDASVPDQRADVYVDGTRAGAWSNPGFVVRPGANRVTRRFQDDEVLIPAAMTSGKRTVTVTIVPVSDAGAHRWTSFRFDAFSMVPPC